MVVERGEKICPTINEAFPKQKQESVEVDTKPKPYYQQVKRPETAYIFSFQIK